MENKHLLYTLVSSYNGFDIPACIGNSEIDNILNKAAEDIKAVIDKTLPDYNKALLTADISDVEMRREYRIDNHCSLIESRIKLDVQRKRS